MSIDDFFFFFENKKGRRIEFLKGIRNEEIAQIYGEKRIACLKKNVRLYNNIL